jgi:hypothetical protein
MQDPSPRRVIVLGTEQHVTSRYKEARHVQSPSPHSLLPSTMSEEWKVTESDDEEELEDNDSYLTSNHDAILFAINCSKSMLTPQRGQERSNLESVLQCAVDIEKGKVKRGPYDSVGILLFNTVRCLFFVWILI